MELLGWYIFALIFGCVIGGGIVYLIKTRNDPNPVGDLKVYMNGTDEPYLFLALEEDVSKIIHSKNIVLKVDVERRSRR